LLPRRRNPISPRDFLRGGAFRDRTEATASRRRVAYRLEGADAQTGPFAVVQSGISTAKYDYVTITVPDATYAYYRIVVEVDGGED
jgi:hypothetical protein